MKKIPVKLRKPLIKLYEARNELKEAFKDFNFTLDGKLIGDIGETIAIQIFNLEKLETGTKAHDCKTYGKKPKFVQIKTTQKKEKPGRIALGYSQPEFDNLIAIEISEDGMYEVIYNGPGKPILEKFKNRQSKNGYSISIKYLMELNSKLKPNERIAKRSK